MEQITGKASLSFQHPPVILSGGSVVGTKEEQGPYGSCFDLAKKDDMAGEDNWEAAESLLQKEAAEIAMQKAGIRQTELRYLFGGDLLGQLIATSFGAASLSVPFFGLYGACSTMGEALSLAAMTVSAGYGEPVMALASSHFATAEKQFRFPLGYGNQRPLSATWTVTGCGAFVIGNEERQGGVSVTGITTGRTIDAGIKDSMNMGAAMAPAAFDTIYQNFQDFQRKPEDYDKIITGDLGTVGGRILLDLMNEKGIDLKDRYLDCGAEIYDPKTQDTHGGGSGCGCSAVMLAALILPRLQEGRWKRVLFVPTGALLSTVSFNEGQSIPGIAHAVVLETRR